MMILLNSNGNLIFSRESGRYHINSNPTLLVVKPSYSFLDKELEEGQKVFEIDINFKVISVI